MLYSGRTNLTPQEAEQFASAMQKINWKSHDEREAFAETIVRELREEIQKDDLISLLQVEVQNFKEGQTIEWVTRKGLKAYVHEPGSYAPRSTITNKVTTMSAEMVSVNTEMELGQLRAGRYGTVQSIRAEALEVLRGRKYSIIWSTLIGSVATSAANYFTISDFATHAAKRAMLDSGCNYVADQQGSSLVAIIGRRTDLEFLSDHTTYSAAPGGPSEAVKSVIDNNIAVPTYRGVPVVYLNQYSDTYGANQITEGSIMILGRETLKLGYERNLDFEQSIDSNTLVWNIHLYEKYGLGVFNALRNAKLKITS